MPSWCGVTVPALVSGRRTARQRGALTVDERLYGIVLPTPYIEM